jgi:hypothetical protein
MGMGTGENMKSRWLVNLVLLVLVAGIAAFLYLRPQPVNPSAPQIYTVSQLDPNSFTHLSISLPGKAPVLLEKREGRWFMNQPYQARADLATVGRVLSIVGATTKEKFPASDLARFGLDAPLLKVKIDNEEFSFGMYHPVTGEQFVAYKDAVYVLPTAYSDGAETQPLELLDKRLLDNEEQKIVGFDMSKLEQWEPTGMLVDMQPNGKWKVTPEKGKYDQDAINEWYSDNWQNVVAKSVEPWKPDHQPHPYVTLKLKNGKNLRIDKIQESPELLLAREDLQILYHLPQDAGFVMLNPPAGFRPQ